MWNSQKLLFYSTTCISFGYKIWLTMVFFLDEKGQNFAFTHTHKQTKAFSTVFSLSNLWHAWHALYSKKTSNFCKLKTLHQHVSGTPFNLNTHNTNRESRARQQLMTKYLINVGCGPALYEFCNYMYFHSNYELNSQFTAKT